MESCRDGCQALKKLDADFPAVIHLDTNFLIDALVPDSIQETQLVGWLRAGETPEMDSMMKQVRAELYFDSA